VDEPRAGPETPISPPPPEGQPASVGRERARQAAERMREPFLRFVTLRWVPLTAALLSLVLSVVAIIVSTRQPEVMLIMPDVIRVAQGRASDSAYIYLQPAFVSTGTNERVEVIRAMTLEVIDASGQRAPFTWDQQLRLVNDPESGGLSYEYVADAVPLLVGPRDAAAPLSLFDAPDGWHFAPGTYRFVLLADRVVVGQPLSGEFEVTLSAADIAFLEQPGGDRFLAFPID
jgi:hypothetical protein